MFQLERMLTSLITALSVNIVFWILNAVVFNLTRTRHRVRVLCIDAFVCVIMAFVSASFLNRHSPEISAALYSTSPQLETGLTALLMFSLFWFCYLQAYGVITMSITIQILSYTHRQKQGIDAQTLVKKIGLAETVSGKLRQMQSMGWTKADERGRLSLTPRGEFFAKLFAKTKAVLAWGDGG